MIDNNDYILPSGDSENEDSNNKIIQIPKPLTKKKRGCLAKNK